MPSIMMEQRSARRCPVGNLRGMELLGRIDPSLPLLVVAVALEAQEIHTDLPILITGVGKVASGQAIMETLAGLPQTHRPKQVINLGTAGALVDDIEGAEFAALACAVLDEVISPHVVRVLRPQPQT